LTSCFDAINRGCWEEHMVHITMSYILYVTVSVHIAIHKGPYLGLKEILTHQQIIIVIIIIIIVSQKGLLSDL
jgi:hypothetical protein